jgi:hypothetical protein
METDNYIFVIGKNDANTLSELCISDVFDVRDRNKKRLILSKLLYNSTCKFFVESNFLKVLSVDNTKNKLILDLDEESNKLFRMLDNKAIDLLGDLLNNNLKTENIEVNLEGNLTYIPLVSDDKNNINTLRLCLDTKTTIMFNKNLIDFNNIKVGDMFRFLIGVESINLYSDESICFLRTFCHTAEIYRSNIDKLTKRVPINNYVFSTDVDNVFQKVVLDDQDISLIKTEVENENTFVNNNSINNLNVIPENDNVSSSSSSSSSNSSCSSSSSSSSNSSSSSSSYNSSSSSNSLSNNSNKNIFTKQPTNDKEQVKEQIKEIKEEIKEEINELKEEIKEVKEEVKEIENKKPKRQYKKRVITNELKVEKPKGKNGKKGKN